MKGTIELKGMEFHSFHGCLFRERMEGNRFVVDLSCEYDMTAAMRSDDLSDAVDYGGIYDIVAEQMSQPANLLEHVAGRIVEAVVSAYPVLEHVKVKVAKANPPVAGPVQWSSVTAER